MDRALGRGELRAVTAYMALCCLPSCTLCSRPQRQIHVLILDGGRVAALFRAMVGNRDVRGDSVDGVGRCSVLGKMPREYVFYFIYKYGCYGDEEACEDEITTACRE